MKILFLSLAFFGMSIAEANSSNSSVYVLKNLRPINISHFSSPQRLHLRFENEQGNHSLIFPESPEKQSSNLLQAIAGWQSICTLEIECAAKAFCTGDCKNMYYEITNPLTEKKCNLRSFTCGPALNSPAVPTSTLQARP